MLPDRVPVRGVSSLGPLETQVMDVVWTRAGAASVRDVQGALDGDPAYTTVMTTLDRLFKKGLLTRDRDGRGFVYSARVSRSDLSSRIAAAHIVGLLGFEPAARPVLSAIVDAVSDSDAEMLGELERLVRLKRRELEGDA